MLNDTPKPEIDRDCTRLTGADGVFDRAWRHGLLLAFLLLLLLIVFVTGIGYQQIEAAHARLQAISELHVKKLDLTKRMHMLASQRTLLLQKVILMADPFERDALRLTFDRLGTEFGLARGELRTLELSADERRELERQARITREALPIQQQVLDLAQADRMQEAAAVLMEHVVPLQERILATLAALDHLSRKQAMLATEQAKHEGAQAGMWMLGLSAAALLLGAVVAGIVFRQASRASRDREYLALHDALTGLPNRRLFFDRLGLAIAKAQRDGKRLGVMFIDLDNFKPVNDSLGHAAGDALLRAVSERLRATVRAQDTVARVGGDEFVVLVGDISHSDELFRLAERILDNLSKPFTILGREVYAGCSIGISSYPEDGTTPEALCKCADIAMYQAKQAGRGCFRLYDPEMNRLATEHLELETALRQALERDEFELVYQPQIDVTSGALYGMEALLRWRHPQRGLLTPAQFLPVAEQSDLILHIGRRSLLKACEQCRGWLAQGYGELKVAVNLSSREFWRGDIVGSVREALEQTGLPPRLLQLELTEGILMENVETAAARVRELKALGVMIAVDDFGTGYASLAHLVRFPIDVLKVDRYFVQDIDQHLTDRAIVCAILALAESLQLDVVAEGVERAPQIDLLRGLGCHLFQGYYVSRPLAPVELSAWLRAYQARATDLSRLA